MNDRPPSSSDISQHQRQQSTATPVPKPAVSVPESSHLDPNTAVRGTHQIKIAPHVVIHPRCQLHTEYGPLSIGERTIICEKCIVGSQQPLQSTGTAALPESTPATDLSLQTFNASVDRNGNEKTTGLANGIEIGHHVHVHPNVQIHHPCSLSPYSVLESNVVISSNVSVGRHSKICANITLPPGTVIPDYTVVYGESGNPQRRRRQKDAAEEGRLAVLEKEREASILLLKSTALKGLSSSSTRKK